MRDDQDNHSVARARTSASDLGGITPRLTSRSTIALSCAERGAVTRETRHTYRIVSVAVIAESRIVPRSITRNNPQGAEMRLPLVRLGQRAMARY